MFEKLKDILVNDMQLPEKDVKLEAELIAETPHARPSRPSIKLTALVSPTIQITVISTDHPPNGIY